MEHEIVLQEKQEVLNPFGSVDNFKESFDIGKQIASSKLVPQAYQGNPTDCVIAIDMANRMGVSPMMVMQNLYVVKGKPAWSGQACAALIAGSGKFKNIKHIYTGERGTDTRGCYLRATRVEDGEVVEGTEITMSMAKAEGWYSRKDKYGNETSKWQTMPEQMLAYRASAFFARVHIPNALMGVQLADEIIDTSKGEMIEGKTQNPFQVSEKVIDEAEEVFG